MNIENIAAIIFLVLLALLVVWQRKKLTFQKIFFPVIYFVMWKTKIGLNFMNSFAAMFRKQLNYLSYVIIFVGFAGMLFLSYTIIASLVQTYIKAAPAPAVGLVLPVQAKGVFFVPFFYWIISIFILAVVHEFSHGIFARLFDIKVKSSGFAALAILVPIIPAAFVEPDERQLKKKSRREQLAIFASGSFANILLALLILAFSFVALNPIVKAITENQGVEIIGFDKELSPANLSGMHKDEVITGINGIEITTLENFTQALSNKKPGDKVDIMTNVSSYTITLAKHPKNESKGYLGVSVTQRSEIKQSVKDRYGKITIAIFTWLVGLLFFLYILNFGIGLFNLIPIGPIDGGRMLLTALEAFFEKKKARKIWGFISILFLFLVIVGVLNSFGFIR